MAWDLLTKNFNTKEEDIVGLASRRFNNKHFFDFNK